MSRAGGYVRFTDGTVKAFMYDGTTDVVWPALFNTSDEAWDAYSSTKGDHFDDYDKWHRIFQPEAIGSEEDVEVYSDYGGGFWWHATATRNRILTKLDWDEFVGDLHDGAPEWLKKMGND